MFLSAIGSGVGGFIGVIAFFCARVLFEWWRSKPKELKIYLFGNSQNRGQLGEFEGELMHHHGRYVNELESRRLGVEHPVWEWTKECVGRDSGASVIYGPYSTDFAEPGLYSCTFCIRGIGFPKEFEIQNDLILLQLDVNQVTSQYYITEKGPTELKAQNQIARKFIKASDLARQGWQEFELPFYSDVHGLWEYRVIAYDGLDNKPDNIGKFGFDARIFFDKIIIKQKNKFHLPWV
jgi:hypothetical protein